MTEPTVFPDANQTPDGNPAPAAPQFTVPDQVKEFVGEGKKYATVEEALKSIPHAQKHIQSLTQAADAAKAEAEKLRAERETYEAFMRQQREENTNSQPSALDPTQVESIVQRSLQEQARKATEQNNLSLVAQELGKTFGEKAKDLFDAKGKELGLDLNALAKVSPKAVLEFFKQPKEASPTPAGSINPAALPNFTRPADHKPVMFGAKTEDLLQAWRNAKPQ